MYEGPTVNLNDDQYPINRMDDTTWITDAEFDALRTADVGDGGKQNITMAGGKTSINLTD
jgi:hypothetical protein